MTAMPWCRLEPGGDRAYFNKCLIMLLDGSDQKI